MLLLTTLVLDLVLLAEVQRRSDDRPAASGVAGRQLGPVAGGRTAPEVAPLRRLREPHLLIVAKGSLPPESVGKVRGRKGVAAVEVLDAARVTLDGTPVGIIGVDPSTFRAYTPAPTARSDALWRGVAAGEVAVSFGLGTDGGLALGSSVQSAGLPLRVGAHATMGIGAVDAVVSRQTAQRLGVPSGNALLVSMRKGSSAEFRTALSRTLPPGTQVVPIRPEFVPPPSRSSIVPLATGRIRTALAAAASKLGAPYVWGAEGPDTFDCSGLVQWAFARAGVRLPRVTHQQFASGPQIPFSEIQPGDLVFWRLDPTNPDYISHVAIYWGDGKMIQAPRTGDVVKIIPVHTRNLAGVVRVTG